MQMMMRDRYLDLMEKVLTGTLIEDPPILTDSFKEFYRTMVREVSGDANPKEEDMARYQETWRAVGWDQPSLAFTMVGSRRLANFRALVEQAIQAGIPGDIVETGVWRGGASLMAKAVLEAWQASERRVILADSFQGLPPPDKAFPKDAGSTLHQEAQLAVSLEEVKRNFEKFGLLDDRVIFLKGWFRDTLPTAPVERIAVLRLDGDMYESTITALRHLFDKVSPGGFIIVDDYWLPSCRSAVEDYLAERGIAASPTAIDGMGVYFRKA